ncbi:MAG: ribonuclease P protein component [Flavobacteriales bacterium]|jgi:ribonuclease P protein component|nr:ribonuclease P protein component [Flavobacteriales bacterium]|tara:strand:- start:604 stop:978 length:375 start_codon:yes stop_codon:yes gene_type:complete
MFHFPKNQKLCNEKAIERLFENGKSLTEKPFRIIYNIDNNNEDVFLKALIVVPKKRVRLASDRNVIKRRVKEAYRLQKSELEKYLKSNNHQLNLAIIYQKHEILDYKLIEVKIKLLLSRLKEEL